MIWFLYNREQGMDEFTKIDALIARVNELLQWYTADQITVIQGDDITDRIIKLAAKEHIG